MGIRNLPAASASSTLPSLSALPFVRHGFTARTGGVSEGPLSSLNLSYAALDCARADDGELPHPCRRGRFSEESMVMDTYEHGVTVRRVDRRDCGAGYTLPPLPPCDALVTDDPAVTLVTGHADCMAFYAVDPVRPRRRAGPCGLARRARRHRRGARRPAAGMFWLRAGGSYRRHRPVHLPRLL